MIKNKIKVNKKAAIISGILAVIILVAALFVSGILNGAFFKGEAPSTMELNTDKVTGNDFNFLFIGLDNKNRADAIMLLTINENSVKGISIPRNTIFEGERIRDIFAKENGDGEVIDTIRKTLAIPIHYYAKMDLSAVEKIVDNLGGIDFNVPMDMVYDDPYQNLHINLKKGIHTLNGEGVCKLLQFKRGYPDGDLSRIQMHHQFLTELIRQKFNKENIDKASEIFKIISDDLDTNYSIINLNQDMKIISAIGSGNITFETIPGEMTTLNEMPVYELTNQSHLSVMNAFFEAFISGNYEEMKKYCTIDCINNHFMANDAGNVFGVFGMEIAKLREVSLPDYLKGDSFVGYTVTVNCKTPPQFSIIKSQNIFRVFLEKQEDSTYLINDFSY